MRGVNRILVLDGNDGPCVRSLFRVVASKGWDVFLMRPRMVGSGGNTKSGRLFRWERGDDGIFQCHFPVFGYRLGRMASYAMIKLAWRRLLSLAGEPDVTVYTLPQYCGCACMGHGKRAYFAYDAYRYYSGWLQDEIERQERRMLELVDISFAVSRLIIDDWSGLTKRPAVYLPNAINDELAGAYASAPSRSEVLSGIDGKIVGCVGAMNAQYDWPAIDLLAERFPDVSFVFLGRVQDRCPEMDIVVGRSNVHMLGHVGFRELASCLKRIDVLLIPFCRSPLNDRRSPLRLFDYLLTDHPILSTRVAAVAERGDLAVIGEDAVDLAKKLEGILAGRYDVDVEQRRVLAARETWEARADDFLRQLSAQGVV